MHVLIHVYDVLDQLHVRVVAHDELSDEGWSVAKLTLSSTIPLRRGAGIDRDLLAEIGEEVLNLAYQAGPLT